MEKFDVTTETWVDTGLETEEQIGTYDVCIQLLVLLQTLDRQTVDKTNPRQNKLKTYLVFVISWVCYVLS